LRDSVDGAVVIEARTNLGFGCGNNLAALHARAEFLCLLNSDALVGPNWLDPLLARFDDPTIGAVVPSYVWPGGMMQEAGCAVEPDGRAVALGAHEDRADPTWCFPRIVTYGSAACMMIRRDAFIAAGGFDPRYGIGYYEDVDLSFRLRQAGSRVAYEPAVAIVHAQGGSSTSGVAVARRDANQERFRARWEPQLRDRPALFGRPRHRLYAARDFEVPDRVLIIARQIPAADDRLARAALALLHAMDAGMVTIAASSAGPDPFAFDSIVAAGIEVVVVEDWKRWCEERSCHYAIVTGDLSHSAEVGATLQRTQPQATRVWLPDDETLYDNARLASWLLEHGLVPRGTFGSTDRAATTVVAMTLPAVPPNAP
jgi:hypothetical protein